MGKFGLTDHLKGIVATIEGTVLCNWELVLIAKASKVKDVEVTVIDNLTEDEIPQVIAVKNVRKKLSKEALVDLIVDFRDYLTKNEAGKVWADEIPGDSTDAKIGTLVGYSYGMINGYQKINKLHPEFLRMMDAGEITYTQAMAAIKEEAERTASGENNGNPTTPKKSSAPKHNYAGERNMMPCAPMESIQIRYADGRTIDVAIDGNSAVAQLFDQMIEPTYSPKKESFDGGAEFHRLDFNSGKDACFIELVIKKAA